MGRRFFRTGPKIVLGVICGIVFGFFLGTWSQSIILSSCGRANEFRSALVADGEQIYDHAVDQPQVANSYALSDKGRLRTPTNSSSRKLMLIGVMTARKYLNSRVIAAYETWARTVQGDVMFFSSSGSEAFAPSGIPVVGLTGVDDSYPPQKKSFLMLKYMYENYGDRYEWFMRADDDVYIKGDKMATFLHSINSSEPQFIGQAGLGNKAEFGLLSLKKNENFCMGGPGMIFSHTTLKKVVPNVSYCLKNLYTTHEDVEIGRCVQKFAGVSCSWAFEMQQLFYHNHVEPNGSYSSSLKRKDIHQAITLHPFKSHSYQYRMHGYLLSNKAQGLRHQILHLLREIYAMNDLLQDRDDFYSPNRLGVPPSLSKFAPKQREEVLSWEFISKSLYSEKELNPMKGIATSIKMGLEDLIMQTMQMINVNARQRGRTIDFKEILYGYHRVNPLHGVDYVMDLLLTYRKHKGKKMTIPVRRHAYLQQTFCEIEFIEDSILYAPPLPQTAHNPKVTTTQNSAIFHMLQKKIDLSKFAFYQSRDNWKEMLPQGEAEDRTTRTIHFILPLAGRFPNFMLFMQNFEDVCLRYESKVVLAVMLFQSQIGEDRTADTVEHIRLLQTRYPQHDLRVVQVQGSFSRGIALETGSQLFPSDALLFFIDVDIYLSREAIHRIRWNTVQHHQVYYPIVFSQFDPSTNCIQGWCPERSNPFNYNDTIGYWRMFGFGIVSMFNSDFKLAGGFDKTISGWGKEDVDLFTRFLLGNLTMFRAVDPGMVHIFHPVKCDPTLESAQYKMCLGTKSSSYGSTQQLARMVYNMPGVLNRDLEISAAEKGRRRGDHVYNSEDHDHYDAQQQ